MRRPTNISLPPQIHELVVSTYFLKFINKETLAFLLYQAMVTLLNASLNLLIITWNLLYRHCHPTSKTRPTSFSNCRILASSPKTLSSSRLMFLPYTLTYHIRKAKKLADIFLTPVLKNLFPLKESATLSEWSLEWTISLSMVNTSCRPMAPRWARAWHLPMQICSWEILNSLPSKTPLWNHLSGGDISMTFSWSGLKEKIILKPLLTT